MDTAVKEHEKNRTDTKEGKYIDGPEYSIYNYFRANTGVLLAVVPGIVAVTSFIFKYASTLYNHTYLRFWDIDIVHARQEDIGVFYTAFGVFAYYGLMMFAQGLLSNTASVYGHHNNVYLARKASLRRLKKKKKTYQKLRKRQLKRLKKATNNPKRQQHTRRIEVIDKNIAKLNAKLAGKNAVWWYRARLLLNVFLAWLGSFVLCFFGANILSLSYEAGTRGTITWVLTLAPTLLSILLYGLKRQRKVNTSKLTDGELEDYTKDMEENRIQLFPAEALLQKGVKYFVTNSAIGALVVQYFITVVACVFVLVSSGSRHAEDMHEFRVWTDGISTYAIIYDNGDQVIMEPIMIVGNNAVIDASVQRVVRTDDLSYEIYAFDKVDVIRSGDEKPATEESVNGTTCPLETDGFVPE